jgi:hypothetical protein
MSEINNAPDDWGSANNRQSFQPKTLHITKENKSIYLTVVWMLGLTIFISMAGIIGLSFLKLDVPQALIALGSVAVGALGSLFTHSK